MTQLEQIKDEVIVRVLEAANFELRPRDVEKAVSSKLGASLQEVQKAVKVLVEEGELRYVHRDPCDYLEIPPAQSHHAARPMDVVFDSKGDPWLCDAGVDPSGDLERQGCWRCGDLPFTRND